MVLLGTPVEEGGGKIRMLDGGAFDGIDVAWSSHPASNRTVIPTNIPMDASWALAMIGGKAPNVVPNFAAANFMLRSADNGYLKEVVEKVQHVAEGAALKTGAQLEIKLGFGVSEVPVAGHSSAMPATARSELAQQQLAIGRALMARPRLLVLDEPSLGLAPLVAQTVFRLIARIRANGTTVVLVEQNARAALKIADRGYLLETGSVVLEGSASALLASDVVVATYLGRA